jgi:hypothetical protein
MDEIGVLSKKLVVESFTSLILETPLIYRSLMIGGFCFVVQLFSAL